MSQQYAVIGNPIAHSKSPLIHHAFAEQFGHNIHYSARLIAQDQLIAGVSQLIHEGFLGFNVTVPFKEAIWQWVAEKSERALLAGAVNTVMINKSGQHYGDNTDGVGLCHDLTQNHHIELTGKRILLLGAGGAAKGVIAPLLSHNPSQLTIANRTVSKAQQLTQQFAHLGQTDSTGFEDIEGAYDIIINATSASLQGDMPPIPVTVINQHSICYDMMYSATDTVFMQWGRQHGAKKVIDGLGMLVEQAAEAYLLWHGVRPQTHPVIASLR